MTDKNPYCHRRFPGQKEGEQIKLLVRKHWIIDFKIAFMFSVLGLVPLAVAIATGVIFWDGTFSDGFLITVLIFTVYMLFMTLLVYIQWLNEDLDIIIVTNERVVSHDQIDMFHRQICETSIAQIQDVKGVEEGMLSGLLGYGMLEVQTAAKNIVFRIHHVTKPYESARFILDIRDRYIDKEKFEKPPESPVYSL